MLRRLRKCGEISVSGVGKISHRVFECDRCQVHSFDTGKFYPEEMRMSMVFTDLKILSELAGPAELGPQSREVILAI